MGVEIKRFFFPVLVLITIFLGSVCVSTTFLYWVTVTHTHKHKSTFSSLPPSFLADMAQSVFHLRNMQLEVDHEDVQGIQ